MNSKELIAYTASFVAWILPKIEIEEIIIFGSSARGEATKESDIDLFFNVKQHEKKVKTIIERELSKYYKSTIYENWYLKGIRNQFHIEVGNLTTWKVKRSIVSDGVLLYGKYREAPETMKAFMHFTISPIRNIAKRNKVMRWLFGRVDKGYKKEGKIKETEGKKLSVNSFIIPLEKAREYIKFFQSEKIDFRYFEFWTDEFP